MLVWWTYFQKLTRYNFTPLSLTHTNTYYWDIFKSKNPPILSPTRKMELKPLLGNGTCNNQTIHFEKVTNQSYVYYLNNESPTISPTTVTFVLKFTDSQSYANFVSEYIDHKLWRHNQLLIGMEISRYYVNIFCDSIWHIYPSSILQFLDQK